MHKNRYREGYPEELSLAEEKFLRESRKARNKPQDFSVRDCTGVGLSGGGIRSATFCLGLFQGLAGLKMLSDIDFISTVSGGGYFGSFYTRFFLRREVPDLKYVEDTLAPCSSPDGGNGKDAYQRNIITWLRENGRYLSPAGSGDLLLAGAVLLRNWLVVHIVLATFFLLLFLSAQLLRIPVDAPFHAIGFLKEQGSELVVNLPGGVQLWLTPFVTVPILLFLFGAVPIGWAYWMVGHQPAKTELWKRPACGLVFVVLVAFAALVLLPVGSETARNVAIGVLVLSALTAFWSCFDEAYSRRSAEAEDPATGAKSRAAFKDEMSRNLASSQLKAALLITLAALAFVAIDSLGQTVYLVLLTPGATLKSWAGGMLGLLVALVPFATRIMISFRGANGGKRPKWLTKIAAAVAAFGIAITIFTTISVGANAIAWTLQRPTFAPPDLGHKPPVKLSEAEVIHDPQQPNNWSMQSEAQPDLYSAEGRNRGVLGFAWGIAFALSFLFGQSWLFLNRSAQLPLYSARLTRAYLGASNPRRLKTDESGQSGGAVTRVISGDDIDIECYWPWPPLREEKCEMAEKAKDGIYSKGTPLHLVNVTINETLDSKSQIQQQDRKGIGMALGPAGLSAGVRHHVVFERASGKVQTFPEMGFRMFNYGSGPQEFTGERLSLGQWLGISGAAFSTGLGARTNLALSLLTGLANIRLGYWWNSGIEPRERVQREKRLFSQWLGSKFTRFFPVQSYLMDEYTARYHGTARKHWNLSDGGHFENMGGYELIRRRLRLIIIIDAEADPDYTFGGLAGLVRKARIDFGAEITFLDDQELSEIMPSGHSHCFSTLENLRRGKLIEESLPVLNRKEGKRRLIDPVAHQRHSLAHAALASVSYDCKEQPESCLIYIKPTILGDEPLDVLQYHVENPSFPQQTTADQFFDEAQWESYRALGEHIANEVFKVPAGEDREACWESVIEKTLLKKPAGSPAQGAETAHI